MHVNQWSPRRLGLCVGVFLVLGPIATGCGGSAESDVDAGLPTLAPLRSKKVSTEPTNGEICAATKHSPHRIAALGLTPDRRFIQIQYGLPSSNPPCAVALHQRGDRTLVTLLVAETSVSTRDLLTGCVEVPRAGLPSSLVATGPSQAKPRHLLDRGPCANLPIVAGAHLQVPKADA
jgi:hypothetical protein